MTVYVLAQLKFTDRARYEAYAARFMPILRQFGGRLLCNDVEPQVLEGSWRFDKAVVFSFGEAAQAHRFLSSPEYGEISVDRKAGARGLVLLLQGLDTTPA